MALEANVTLYSQALPAVAAEGLPARFQLWVGPAPMPGIGDNDVLVRMGGAPINPSDGGIFGGLDAETLARGTKSLEGEWTKFEAAMPEGMGADLVEPGPVGTHGNEGAGTVVQAGVKAIHLLDKVVFVQGNTYTKYVARDYREVREQLPEVTAKEAASFNCNPMTVLCMLEKMRRDGHKGIVHTAAASQLGHMLLRVCIEEGIPLVNIVRRPESEQALRALGATHVLNSATPSFREDLIRALAETGATIAFDAIGGGTIASTILECMEAAAWRRGVQPCYYGSSQWKCLYNYGKLDPSPAQLSHLAFGGYRFIYGGFMLPDFLEKTSEEWRKQANERIARGIKTTFATSYGHEVSLEDLLEPANLATARAYTMNKKFLVVP